MYMLNSVEIETQNCENAFHEIKMQKDKTIDSSSALVSFSCNRNKNKNSFTKLIGLTRVTNSRVVAHKSYMATCSPRAPEF